jgi:hypothetical protein
LYFQYYRIYYNEWRSPSGPSPRALSPGPCSPLGVSAPVPVPRWAFRIERARALFQRQPAGRNGSELSPDGGRTESRKKARTYVLRHVVFWWRVASSKRDTSSNLKSLKRALRPWAYACIRGIGTAAIIHCLKRYNCIPPSGSFC